MTQEQLEAAARKLCELEGLDPDHTLPIGVRMWETKTSDVLAFWRMCKAVDHAFPGCVFP
jgi:hypothetical protein